jgi:hypothetical protein
VNYLAGGESPGMAPHPGKLKVIFQYLSGFAPSIYADAFIWTDPLPEFVGHWQVLRKGIAALVRGLRKDPERLSAPLP